MRGRHAGLHLAALLGMLVAPLLAILPAQPAVAATGFASSAFQSVWTRTDQPVEDLSVKRTWLWGPQPLNALNEPYAQSPGGQRQVQYFDKSRMEINNPNTQAVTNGLLATELIRGRLQYGDNYDAEGEERGPAAVNVAGDSDDTGGPTYASLRGLLGQPPLAAGTTITQTVARDGSTGDDPSKASLGVTAAYFVPETQQSVASVFWDYLQTTGPVVVNGQRRDEKLFDPTFYATGLPITRPYWARVKVAGTVQDVMLQAFERRVLTYTPDNPEGFKVEMGNVGRHYYTWRYGQEPTAAPPTTPASDFRPRTGPHIGYGFNGFFAFTPAGATEQQANLNRSLQAVDDAGFDWVRQQVVWATLEPSPGQYNVELVAALDALVREAAQRNFRVMLTITKAPRWAVAGDEYCRPAGATQECGLPRDPQSLARLVTWLATKYRNPEGGKYAGTVAAFEIWNEQNTAGETGNNIQPGTYVELLKAGYNAIKAVDPRYIVVYGGLTPTGENSQTRAIDDRIYLEQTYQYNGGEVKRYFDVLGVHPGSNNNSPDAIWPSDDKAEAKRICEQQKRQWCDDPSFYFRRVEQLRKVMEQYGDALYGTTLKQIWLSEFGWTTKNRAPGYEYGDQISEQTQAQYIVRAFEKGQKDYPWMGVMFLWTLNHSIVVGCDDEKYPWSVLYGGKCPEEQAAGKQAWDPRPAYTALQQMNKNP